MFISASKFQVTAHGDVTGSQVLFTGGKIAGLKIIGNVLSGSIATLDAACAALYMTSKGPDTDNSATLDHLRDE